MTVQAIKPHILVQMILTLCVITATIQTLNFKQQLHFLKLKFFLKTKRI